MDEEYSFDKHSHARLLFPKWWDRSMEVLKVTINEFIWKFIKRETLNYWHFTCTREYTLNYLIKDLLGFAIFNYTFVLNLRGKEYLKSYMVCWPVFDRKLLSEREFYKN